MPNYDGILTAFWEGNGILTGKELSEIGRLLFVCGHSSLFLR